MKNTFKVKSLNPAFTDLQVADNSAVIRFISFENAINLCRERYGITDELIGYAITDRGN